MTTSVGNVHLHRLIQPMKTTLAHIYYVELSEKGTGDIESIPIWGRLVFRLINWGTGHSGPNYVLRRASTALVQRPRAPSHHTQSRQLSSYPVDQ